MNKKHQTVHAPDDTPTLSRREVISAGITTGVAAIAAAASVDAGAQERNDIPDSIRQIKALTFDVFGTDVVWRSSIIREGQPLGKRKGLDTDWAA